MIIETSGDTLSKNLVYLRTKYALSRRALAKLIGISPYTLQGIENGTLYPALSAGAFTRICEVFHVSPDTLAQTDLTIER